MQIIKIIVAILLYIHGIDIFVAFQLNSIRRKNTDVRLAIQTYILTVVVVIAATLLLRN